MKALPQRGRGLDLPRWIGLLAVAGLAAAALVRALPPDDPLRGTLAVLPLAAAALLGLGAWAKAHGGRRTPRPVAAAEAVLLAVLVLAALGRTHLGIPHGVEGIAAGLALLLAHRVARLLLALRPSLGRTLPERPPVVFFLLPLAVYASLIPWSTSRRPPDGDEPYYLLLAHSLAHDLDADLSDEYADRDYRRFLDRPLEPQPGDPVGPRGEVYSRHNALLPLVLAPAYRMGGKHGALVVMAALTAALAWLTLRVARHYAADQPGPALAAFALVAFTPPLLLYSYQVWVEVPAALLALVALDGILSLRKGSTWGARQTLLIGVPLILLPLLKIRFMALAAPLLALAWWRAGRPRTWLVVLAVVLALVAGGILLHNQVLYGNPLKIHTWHEVELYDYGPVQYARGFAGMFFDCAFGLFASGPLWLLLLPAAVLWLRLRHPIAAHLAVFACPYLVLAAPRPEWYGGWSPPFRYPLVLLPLLGIGLIPLLARRRGWGPRFLLASLSGLTLVLAVAWIAVPGWTYDLADGRTHLLDHLSQRLEADVARFFPSYVRPRLASWLWPPLALVAVGALWFGPRRRSGAAGSCGVAALLGAIALLAWAAHRVPTHAVEVEDPWVAKSGGYLHPERWVIDRSRFHGGWVLHQGEGLAAEVVPGGERVDVAVDLEFIAHDETPLLLELRAGGQRLAAWQAEDPRRRQEVRFEDLPWQRGARRLELRVQALPDTGSRSGLIVDRIRLEWE